MEVIEKYEVGTKTMLLVEEYHLDYNTIIHDVDGVYCTKQTVKSILNEACLERASTYDGRIQAARTVTPYMKKTPLMICLIEKIYAFPTIGPTNYGCVWPFPENILGVQEEGNGRLRVEFINGTSTSIKCSLHTFNTQKERAICSMNQFSTNLFRQLKERILFI
ncbi:competence protein ComK [Bacillus sp. FJAT-52991]|uniref:Competence protein ComK n=1 Tax=Bacillus kandeliae TaxID=3129297 RepID=A0ABZ2N5L9_9BACI